MARAAQGRFLLSLVVPVMLALHAAHGCIRMAGGGQAHSCALLEDRSVKCWGDNRMGQLGQETTDTRGDQSGEMGDDLPAIEFGAGYDGNAVGVSVGQSHACALFGTGAVKCWGGNTHGQLATGDTASRGDEPGEMGNQLLPINLGNGRTATAIVTGDAHNCALLDDRSVKCWGWNAQGQLGQGDTADRGSGSSQMGDNLPRIDFGENYTNSAIAITAGLYHSCALFSDGAVKCWGYNSYGQLGQGDSENRGDRPGEMGDALAPINLGSTGVAVSIAGGGQHTCALLNDGTVKCWGYNQVGQLGQGDGLNRGSVPGTMGDKLKPINLGTGRTAVAIVSASDFSCGVLDDGSAKCWGDNQFGQLGQGDLNNRGSRPSDMGDRLAPIKLGDTSTVTSIATAHDHAIALLSDGSLKGWGYNEYGQLGLGDIANRGGSPADMGNQLPEIDVGSAGAFRICELGTFGASQSSGCAPCENGTWALAGAMSSAECVACSLGKYDPFSGATQCIPCEAGTFGNETGAVSCTACEPGTYSSTVGAVSCVPCKAGSYTSVEGASSDTMCTQCAAGKYSATTGASSEDTCVSCPAGTYSGDSGQAACQGCKAGRYSSGGESACAVCPEGTYSTRDECVDCDAGLTSAAGSNSSEDCQSPVTSFVAGAVALVVGITIVLVYIIRGRASSMAAREKESSISSIIRTSTGMSSILLNNLEWRKQSGILWRVILAIILTIVTFMSAMVMFLAQIFLLSQSLFTTHAWLEDFQASIEVLVDAMPPMKFLAIVPPLVRLVRSIDFSAWLAGVQVTCLGAQAPLIVLVNAAIISAAVLVIGSQLHTMLALALVPTIDLVRDKLTSTVDRTALIRAKNMTRFFMLVVLSSFLNSVSRYIMQVFATLVHYSAFLPYRMWSPACNEDGIDEWLANATTVVFYAVLLPALLLILPVMIPGLPKPLPFLPPEADQTVKIKPKRKRPWWRRLFNCLNPFKWILVGVNWLLSKLYDDMCVDAPIRRTAVMRDSVDDARWHLSTGHVECETPRQLPQRTRLRATTIATDMPSFQMLCIYLVKSGWKRLPVNVWAVVVACAWKIKLSLLLALGIWTDEVVDSLQIEQMAQEHFDWIEDPTRVHEDIMAAVGPMRSMIWMLIPATIVLTKLAEVTNNLPIFVLSNKMQMVSPLIFWSWAEAEEMTRQSKVLLKRLSGEVASVATVTSDAASTPTQPLLSQPKKQPSWRARWGHRLAVALVWLLGARLPRYVINVTLFTLAVAFVARPSPIFLIVSVWIILPFSIVNALGIVTDVILMLRLHKLLLTNEPSSFEIVAATPFQAARTS